jgi:virulence-associated protein VapD
MYAIAFDLDQATLTQSYGAAACTNAYGDIKKLLNRYGFTRQQGSVYFGDNAEVDAIQCVLAVQELAKNYTWFPVSVRDIRMLRIEDNNDLMPAIDAVTEQPTP